MLAPRPSMGMPLRVVNQTVTKKKKWNFKNKNKKILQFNTAFNYLRQNQTSP